jgi:hypothetical protein
MSGNVRGDLSYDSKRCFLIWLAARLLQSAVLDQGERSTGNKYVSGLLPANLGVNPVKRGRREHGLKLLAGKQRILKLSVYIVHLARAFQVLPG